MTPEPSTITRPAAADSRVTGSRSGPLRLAVVGCGAVAERYHLPALLASDAVRVVAFVDPDAARAERLAARVEGTRVVRHHRALLDEVDAAIVTAPNDLHASIACDLLGAGVHVLVEKPMARTSAECEQMRAAAAASGAVLAIGHDFRFFPAAQAAHRLLSRPMLGAIRSADVRQAAGTRWPCISPSNLSRDSGGGVLINFGVHTIDLLSWWLGPLMPVGYSDDAAGGVETECECELVTGDGAPVHLEVSWRRALRDTAVFECERGRVEVGVFEPAFVRITLDERATLESQVPDPEFDAAPLRTVFTRQLNDFADAVASGREPLVTGAEGQNAVEVVERCYAIKEPLRRSWDYPDCLSVLSRRETA